MISQRFALLALSIAASFLTTASAAVLESDKLQEPPMQRADWTPPKCDVPADVVAATARLFQQGLADPRGCEYREIGVRAGDRESGDAGVLACHGWVLPDAGKGAQRFAVCWNGLVYPVEWIGGKATVGTDVEISIERDDGWETFVEQSACSRESGRSTRGPDCLPNERVTVSGHFMLPLRVCLLLRLGEKDLAETFWKAWAAKPGQVCPHYKLLALGLEWSMYDCALNAHRRGDDRLSFVYAASVKLLRESVLKEPAHNGTLTEAQQRQQVVQIIRDYFMKVKGLSPSQRWLTVLRDDDGDWLEWNYAADHLQDLIDNARHRRDDNSQRVANGLTHAMVDALSARIEKMNKAGNETEASYTLKRMADRDMNTVKPLIAMQLHVLLNLEDDQGRSIDMITHFTPLLARAGDRSALQAYMKWIIGQKPDVVGMDALAPLWMFPDDPEMARTAELMFSFSPSNWNPLDIRQYRESIKTPLLGIPGFRAQVVKALADQTADGTATVLADHGLRLVDRDGNVDRNPRSEHIGRSETHMGPVGKEMTLRMCDRIATEISQIGGGPEMKLYWPEEDRNAAVKACVGFLNQYGERFKYREDFDGQAMGSHSYTIAFPSLDHPASKKEAASKEAIFSLEGEGEARVVRDMKLPATARWTTLKSHPFEALEGGKIDFDNYCWIWQAEEVKVNGVWHRYYGVVGPNEIARVPAEEIEFDTPVEFHGNYVLGWTPLSGDADVCASFEKRYQPRGSGFNFAVGEPVLMKLRFHDRSGMPKQWPTSFFSKSDRAMQTRPGMQMSLQWRAREPSPIDDDADNPAQMIQTKYVTLRKTGAPEQLTTVESNGALEAGEFDLRDFFDITKPGIYRLQIRFTTDSRVGEGERPVEFELR